MLPSKLCAQFLPCLSISIIVARDAILTSCQGCLDLRHLIFEINPLLNSGTSLSTTCLDRSQPQLTLTHK